MPDTKKSIEEFAKGIKSKYPQYKDMDDLELANKMVEKYPQYQNSVDFGVKKKDISQQDLGEPLSQEPDPSIQTSSTSGVSEVEDYQSELGVQDVPAIQDSPKDPIVIPEEINTAANIKLDVVKKRIKKNYENLKDQDAELIGNQIYKEAVESTGNPFVAKEAQDYFNKLKNDEFILSTESESLPDEQEQVFKNIQDIQNEKLLGKNFTEKIPDSDVIPNSKIYNDYSNYLKVTDLDEFRNYSEGRYSGGGERSYNFFLDAITHQANLMNAKSDQGVFDEDLYNANKELLEIKFRDAIQSFPEYNQELKDRIARQQEIDESYDEALKGLFSDNYLERQRSKAVVGYYNVVAPAMGAFTRFGADVISASGRMTSLGEDPESARAINNYIDDMDRYFNLEKSTSIYKSPTELKGSLYDDGDFQAQKLLPKTSETLAQMSTLLIGGGKAAQGLEAAGMGSKIASNTGLFISSYMSTQSSYYTDAKEQGMTNNEAMAYSSTAASLTSLLELASPQRYFGNKQITNSMSKNAIKDILGGTSRTKAIAKNFVFTTKEQGKEVMQEIAQNEGDNATNYVFNQLTDSELKTSTTADEYAEIVTLTGVVSGIGSTQGLKTGNTLRSESFYNAMKNQDRFDQLANDEDIVKELGSEKLNQAKSDVKEYAEIFKAISNDYTEFEKMKLATNELDKRRLVEERNNAEKIDPVINQPEIERLDKEIQVVNDEMSKNAGVTKITEEVEKPKELEKKEPIEETSEVKEEKVVTPEEKRQFAIDAVTTGQIVSRKETGKLLEAREDFGIPTKQVNKAIEDIKEGNYETAPAKKLIAKLEEFYEKGDIPVIKGTAGISVRDEGIPIAEITKSIEESKKEVPKEVVDESQETSDEMKDWLDEGDDWEGANIFNNANIAQTITEWKGDKMPEIGIKKAIKKLRENIESGVSKKESITNSLDEMKITDWYKGLEIDKQKAFDFDYRKALGDDMKASEKVEVEDTYVRKSERALLQEKIKNLSTGAKLGATEREASLKSVKKDLVKYADETLKEFPLSKAKQREIGNMIAEANVKNIGKAFDKIDKIFTVREEADKRETVRRIEKIVSDKRSVLRKSGNKWKGKVPISIQEYIKNFDTSQLGGLTRSQVVETENLLKQILKEGAKETSALKRATNEDKRRQESIFYKEFYEGKTNQVSGEQAIIEELQSGDVKIILNDGQLVSSETIFKEVLKDNPDMDLNNITVYDGKNKQLQDYNKKSSIKEWFNKWINPFKAKANLTNNLLPLIKGSKVLRKKVEGLITDVNEAYFGFNKDRVEKRDKYTDDVVSIFSKNIKLPFGKKAFAHRRLSKHADVIPHKEMISPPTNDMIVNWYSLAQTKLGLEGLNISGVDVKMVDEYMSREENKDLKEYSDYLLNDFYPSLKSEYEPIYTHLTNTKFPDDLVYYPTYSEKTVDETINPESIMDKDFNVNYMSPIAGNLKQRVKHNSKLNLINGAHEVAMDYVNKMERAKHFTPLSHSVNEMLSKNNIPEIVNKIGIENFNNLRDHLIVVITGINPRQQSHNNVVNGLMGLRVFGALAFKMASVPKQITSFTHFSTSKGVTLEEWIAGFAPVGRQELDVYKRIYRSDYVKERFKGRSIDIEANRLLDSGKRSFIMKLISRMTRVGMMPISVGDIGGVLIGGTPLALAVYRQGKMDGLSHNEAYEKAYRRFIDESESAQQSTRESETSHMQRDNVGRLFSAFTTSQTQTTNKMASAWRNLFSKSELSPDEVRENLYNLLYYSGANIGFAMVANGFIKELLNSDFEDEDDQESLKKGGYDTAMDNVQSIINGTGYQGVLANFAINKLRGDEWKNTIPILQEFSNVADGATALFHFYANNKEWDDMTDKEKLKLFKAIPIESLSKQVENLVKAAEGDKEFVDAIMNWKSEKEKKGFKPKDDQIYKVIFDKPYHYDGMTKMEKKKFDIKNTPKYLDAQRRKDKKKKEIEERKQELLN